VIVDVAIDQGGCFETSHATTHAEPTYEVDGVIHYCVANMPGAVPITSAHALNNATLQYGLMLADKGLKAIAEDRHLRAGLNVHQGRITNRPLPMRWAMSWRAGASAQGRLNRQIWPLKQEPAGGKPRRVFCHVLRSQRGNGSNCCARTDMDRCDVRLAQKC
jgi:hypothetical protein